MASKASSSVAPAPKHSTTNSPVAGRSQGVDARLDDAGVEHNDAGVEHIDAGVEHNDAGVKQFGAGVEHDVVDAGEGEEDDDEMGCGEGGATAGPISPPQLMQRLQQSFGPRTSSERMGHGV